MINEYRAGEMISKLVLTYGSTSDDIIRNRFRRLYIAFFQSH